MAVRLRRDARGPGGGRRGLPENLRRPGRARRTTARVVDSLVAALFPTAAVRRAYHRDLLALIKNGEKRKREAKYAAATSPRATGRWLPLIRV